MTDDVFYPSDDQLNRISEYPINNTEDYHSLMEYVYHLWHWQDMISRRKDTYVLVTGGWSGNEDIIAALRKNYVFWMMYWESSTRGGKHTFSPISASSMLQNAIELEKEYKSLRKAAEDVVNARISYYDGYHLEHQPWCVDKWDENAGCICGISKLAELLGIKDGDAPTNIEGLGDEDG